MPKLATSRRFAAFRALGRAIRAGNRPDAPGLGQRLGALPRLLRGSARGSYPGLGRGRLAALVFAVAYLVSPVDAMPELLLAVFGLGDDAVVALWLAGAFLDETERFIAWERLTRSGAAGIQQRPDQGRLRGFPEPR